MLKPLETFGKTLAALVLAVLCFRPGRRRRAKKRLRAPGRVLLVRLDRRVGEALLNTPLMSTLARRQPPLEVDLLVDHQVARVLEGHPEARRVIPFNRRALWLGPVGKVLRALRQERYAVVVDASNWTAPSVTNAIVARLAGPGAAVIGPAAWPVGALHDVSVTPRSDTRWEVAQRLHLLSPISCISPVERLSFRPTRVGPEIEQLLAEFRGTAAAIINPGGRLGVRRVPPEAFASAASTLASLGVTPWITWGPGEEALSQEVASLCPEARLAPATTLDELAALFGGARLAVCNNTGPMHLAVSVQCPTLAFFRGIDLDRWGHHHAPHRMVDLTEAVKAGTAAVRARDEVFEFVGGLSSAGGKAPVGARLT